MDIVKNKSKVPFYKNRKLLAFGTVVLFIVVLMATKMFKLTAHSVDSNNFVTAKVQRGDLKVKVSAPGVLAPRDVRWVSSAVVGKVEQIFVKPGASVGKGQLIAELYNPELEQQTQELKWELEAMEAENRALKERQNTRLLDMRAQVLDNQMTYDKEKIRLQAEAELIKSGNATVSKLDYESRKMTVNQLEQTLKMDKARSKQLISTLNAEVEAQSARVNRLKNSLQRAEYQLASLNVIAPVDGILQAMPLELGQRVAIGDNIAKFAKKEDLIAELSVAEFKVSEIRVGQRVMIDTRYSQLEGEVVRVDPAVVDGTVQVDVNIVSQLPEEARPDLSIDGEIYISEIKDTLFVRRPAFSQPNQKMSIFRVDSEFAYAQQTEVEFGTSSSMDIEVLYGVAEGDLIIVSEISDFERYNKIIIN
jgi:HlyD family secretion protein